MPTIAILERAALIIALMVALSAHAAPTSKPERWVTVNDVHVRAGPSSKNKVVGILSRGAKLTLKSSSEHEGYCHIAGEGHYGYVACRYLSAMHVSRPKAGEGDIDAAQRWIGGNAVSMREMPNPEAVITGRMALNTVVKLLSNEEGGDYCKIQLSSGQTGFTACRYLTVTPVILAHIRGYRNAGEATVPDYDPERAFWIEPGWSALELYVEHLKQLHPGISAEGPWPRNEALERMKAHLALGLKGQKPDPFTSWQMIKRIASQEMDLHKESKHLIAQGRTVPDSVWHRENHVNSVAQELKDAIGIWGPLHDATSADGGEARAIHLVRALEFTPVSSSLFRSEKEIAPPSTTAEQASGRFDITFRQLVTPRNKPEVQNENERYAGLYDMLARTQSLVRPVSHVRLFRDGFLRSEPSILREREVLWRESDEPMCNSWVAGFAFGDADARNWRYFGEEANAERKRNPNPAGSLFAFYTTISLPLTTALHTSTQVKLDKNATGFSRGTYFYFDLDGDDIPDLAVWEGEGKGPGHLDGLTKSDNPWYRLALVNIDGTWKILGSDTFGYGCGC